MKNKPNIKKIIKKKIDYNQKTNKTQKPVLRQEVKREIRKISLGKEKTHRVNVVLEETPIIYSNRTFVRREIVDYDALIIISSYDRIGKLHRLLNHFINDTTKYTFKIIVLNDGTDDDAYMKIDSKYPKITLLANEINYGKTRYWESFNKLLGECKKYKSHVVIQLDDDFILCNNFLDNLLDDYFRIKNLTDSFGAISFHRTDRKIPTSWGLKYWVDGGTLFDRTFIELIDYKIDKIDKIRWEFNKNTSSGVWQQLSEKLNNHNMMVYKTEKSLIIHDGNEDSKMNSSHRDRNPIKTWNFIDD